jgi:autotransporter-associated beta strand protein
VNQGTLTLSTPSANATTTVAVPGALVVSNGVVTLTAPSQISNTASVTLNGASTLTLNGANAFSSLNLVNQGGTAAPTVASGTLTLTGALNVTNNSTATVPTISSAVDLQGASRTVDVGGMAPTGLVMSGVISSAGGALVKTGSGGLVLGGVNTFNGGVTVNGGSLMVSTVDSTPSTVGATVTSGPLGTGALTLADGVRILAVGANRTVANAVIANEVNFGISQYTLTLNGNISFTGSTGTISVDAPTLLNNGVNNITVGGTLMG